jgi:hypothetical protein
MNRKTIDELSARALKKPKEVKRTEEQITNEDMKFINEWNEEKTKKKNIAQVQGSKLGPKNENQDNSSVTDNKQPQKSTSFFSRLWNNSYTKWLVGSSLVLGAGYFLLKSYYASKNVAGKAAI